VFHPQLTESYVLEYTYRRSTGAVVGRFLTELGQGRILGLRSSAGRVIVPPPEFDPATGASIEGEDAWVEVGPSGTIKSWTWVDEPRPQQPFDRPFAWALIELDGADTAMLHAVIAPKEDLRTGLRVRAVFADEPAGTITDLKHFEPDDGREEASR